jgi:phosphosulfolactate synthase (CoM biosynthesis protein A)
MVMRSYSLQIEDVDLDTVIFEADTGNQGQIMITGICHDMPAANCWAVNLKISDIEALQDFLAQVCREYRKFKGEDY